MNKEEQEIIESTKEFAKAHNIHYDQMTENMILNAMREQLLLHNVVQAKPEKVCELMRQKFDDWVFGLETQAGEKLKVVDSTDFNDIITEIESELKDL